MPHPCCGEAYSERGGGREFLDGRSGGVRDILNRRVGGRDGDVAGLAVVEFLEEVGSDDGVVSDEGVELMVGRGWGIDGWVRVSGHRLAVEDAEGVATEGGVGVMVFNGGDGFLLGLSLLGFLRRRWLDRCVEVPRRRGKVPEGGRGVERVVTPSLVSSGGCQDGGYFSPSVVAPFICSTGFRR